MNDTERCQSDTQLSSIGRRPHTGIVPDDALSSAQEA
jgi:hypothetical protein